jgi:hypothetical protein
MSIENENPASCQTAVRRSADLWWRKLNHELRIQYAKEQLAKKGMILKFNNDGLISGLTLSDVVELFRHYA